MGICKNCSSTCYPKRSNFVVHNLEGIKIYVNSELYCSKDCFTMQNMLCNKFKIFESEEIKSQEKSPKKSFEDYMKK